MPPGDRFGSSDPADTNLNGPPVHSDCAARGRVSESLPHAWTVISTVLVIGGDSGEPETGLRRTTAQSDRRGARLPTGDVATLGKSPTACLQPTCEHNGKSGDGRRPHLYSKVMVAWPGAMGVKLKSCDPTPPFSPGGRSGWE